MNKTESGIHKCNFLTFNINKINQVRNTYIAAACLHSLIILPTVSLNILLIASLLRSSELRKPSTKFIFSLAVSDLLLGLILETTLVAKKIAEVGNDFTTYCGTGMVTYIAGSYVTLVSLCTLTAIAIDRFLIVHKGNRYSTLMSNMRVKCVILTIWILVFVIVSGQLYTPRWLYFMIAAPLYMTCIVLSSICYIKSFWTLRQQRLQNENLTEGVTGQHVASAWRYRKSMFTMLYVFVFFNLCSVPFLCTTVAASILGETAAIWGAESIATVINNMNSLINPIVLFWRMKNIRKACWASCFNGTRKNYEANQPC
ncbi:melanocortin receptor 4-like [Exaiptasia diaphana]|uniref:G-protein coupled receptors family 1 profile domain-containing protein n=1 Tax=Exaiptasia diaphana TaxID=2652724 RepID=A0A913YKG7_EXADI|nr:melanocortin receptor 4-like [Exaiptasia diaphana]